MAYPIIDVDPAHARDLEQLGSKPKFWFQQGEQRWLFKEARPNTGEDWAEKVAAQIAGLIGIDAASVDLALCGTRRGTVSPSFLDHAAGDVLIHGNELLGGLVTGYQRDKRFHQADHTLHNIREAMIRALPAEGVDAVLRTLAGYAVLDALIGNTDRHHENWGLIVRTSSPDLRVAPSFDHASSLGRELTDERRDRLLQADQVARYARAGRGGIYLTPTDPHGANPIDLVLSNLQRYREYFAPALARAAAIEMAQVRAILDEIPDERISQTAREFAFRFVEYAQNQLRSVNE
jgi:hypothetical protein